MIKSAIATIASASLAAAVIVISDPSDPPHQVAAAAGQKGYNDCQNYPDSADSMCQTVWFNDFEDFCVFGPPEPNSSVSDTEEEQVTWCTKAGHGARLIPEYTFTGVHWLQTAYYWQITAVGRFDKINVLYGDPGGELDPSGATGDGNPIGGLVLAENKGEVIQIQRWHEFLGYNVLSFRACPHSTGEDTYYCPHIYDEMGAAWNDPGSYDETWDSCQGSAVTPTYIYTGSDGKVTTFTEGQSYTPPAPSPSKTYSCTSYSTFTYATYSTTTTSKKAKRTNLHDKRRIAHGHNMDTEL